MKIATYNINNVNRRLPNLLAWLKRARPDIVCLQELKAADEAFPDKELQRAGYAAVWRGQKTWNGVAILARGTPPIVIRKSLPGDRSDTQSRYIEAAVKACSSAAFTCRTAIRSPGRNSPTSSTGSVACRITPGSS